MKKIFFVILFSVSLGSYEAFGSAKEAAKGVAMAAAVTVAVNAMTGAELMPKCTPASPTFCVMAAMSFAQAMTTGGTTDSANGVADDFDYGGGQFPGDQGFNTINFTDPVTIGGQTFSPQELNNLQAQASQGLKDLEGQGFKVDAKEGTITGPNGNSASISTIGSGYGAAKAGLIDPADAELYDKEIKKMKNKISVVSMPGAGGGGGGASRAAARSYKPSTYSGLEGFKFNMGGKRKPASAQTQGLTKNFGRDPVGTSTDNIFEMLHRNYQKRVQQRQFVQ